MNIDITNDSYELSLLSAEVILSDLPEPTMPISIFAGTGTKHHYIANRDGYLEIFYNIISFPSNPLMPTKADLEQSGLNNMQTNYELATVRILKSRGNIISIATRCLLGEDWHYTGINGTINASIAQDFTSALMRRYVALQDKVYLLGVDQHPEHKSSDTNMDSLASLATLPANVGLTPNIDEFDMDGFVKILTEIKRYFSNSSKQSNTRDLLFIVSDNINTQLYKSFNSGGKDYIFVEDLIQRFIPNAGYVATSLIENSMFVFDIQYCTFIVGNPVDFNFREVDHKVGSLLATNAVGSVVCKDPSRILYYKDFVNPPATRTIRTRNVAPASTKATASDAETTSTTAK